MKQNKYLLIGVSALLVVAILMFVLRKKIFKKSSAAIETDNINLDANTQPAATVSATATPLVINDKNVGDKAYSNATQLIARVEIQNGNYVNVGTGTIGNGSLIGHVVKLTPHGYYIKSISGLKSPYYYLGTSQVK